MSVELGDGGGELRPERADALLGIEVALVQTIDAYVDVLPPEVRAAVSAALTRLATEGTGTQAEREELRRLTDARGSARGEWGYALRLLRLVVLDVWSMRQTDGPITMATDITSGITGVEVEDDAIPF